MTLSGLGKTALGLGGLLLFAGCQHSALGLKPMPALTTSPAGPAKTEQELSGAEAAKACLATAEALEKNGYGAEAALQYEKARAHNPRLTHLSRRLAVLYDRQGDFTRAHAEYQNALKQSPKDADLLNDLGYFHYSRGKWAEAETQLKLAVALNPKHQRAWINLGMALGQQDRYQESLDAFQKAVGPGEAQCNLGFIMATQGKTDEAVRAYRQALALQPDLRLAHVALAKLTPPAQEPTLANTEPPAGVPPTWRKSPETNSKR